MINESRYMSRVKVRKYLENQLLPLGPGEPLPPVRTLMKASGASRSQLEATLQELSTQGLIARRPRAGIFKATTDDVTVKVPVVDLVACGRTGDVRTEGTFSLELIEAFSVATSRRGQAIRLHQFWVTNRLTDYQALVGRSHVRACVLFGLHIPELPNLLDDHHIAWVSLLPQTRICPRRAVIDSGQVTQLQLEHLWELGHRRIGYLDRVNPEAPAWAAVSRRESYYRLMAERGLRVYPHWVANGLFDDAANLAALDQIFSREPYPTALVVRDPQLPVTYRYLESRGWRIGADVSVIGTDDLAVAGTVYPKATTIRNPRGTAAQMALEMMDRVIKGETVNDVREVPVELVVRESTGKAL